MDGGILENIAINNLTMMDVSDYPIYITLGRRNRGPEGTPIGTVRNILISNVIATGVDRMSGIQITGLPGHDVQGVRLENIRLIFKGGGTAKDAARVFPELDTGYPEPYKLGTTPAYGLFARHVRDLELANIRLELCEPGPAPGDGLHGRGRPGDRQPQGPGRHRRDPGALRGGQESGGSQLTRTTRADGEIGLSLKIESAGFDIQGCSRAFGLS